MPRVSEFQGRRAFLRAAIAASSTLAAADLLQIEDAGNDPRTSVVDRCHRSHDVRNLFICDGSSMVSSSRGQPTETISALAFRAGEHIANFARRGEIQTSWTRTSGHPHAVVGVQANVPPIVRSARDEEGLNGVPRFEAVRNRQRELAVERFRCGVLRLEVVQRLEPGPSHRAAARQATPESTTIHLRRVLDQQFARVSNSQEPVRRDQRAVDGVGVKIDSGPRVLGRQGCGEGVESANA